MQRIAVVGTSGSGKTTLSAAMALKLQFTHAELDEFHWEAGWTEADPEVFRARVDAFTAGPQWVVCGNYAGVRDVVWGRATDIVWLDYPLRIVLTRLIRRSVARSLRGHRLWNGNRETLWNSLVRPDSLLMWALKTHRRYHREYAVLMDSGDFPQLRITRLRHPREATAFLETLRRLQSLLTP